MLYFIHIYNYISDIMESGIGAPWRRYSMCVGVRCDHVWDPEPRTPGTAVLLLKRISKSITWRVSGR